MNIVDFKDNYFEQELPKTLSQWSYGQVLRIQGLKLPTAVEVHFSLQEKGGTADIRIGTTKDGITDVQIPDFIFSNNGSVNDYKAYAFIYPSDVYQGTTIHKIIMNVKARPKPKEFITPSDEQLFKKTIDIVNNAMKNTEDFAQNARSYAVGGTGTRMGEDTDNAKYYAESAKLDSESTEQDRTIIEQINVGIIENAKEVDRDKQIVTESADNVIQAEQRINTTAEDVQMMALDVEQNKNFVDTTSKEVDRNAQQVKTNTEETRYLAERVDQAAAQSGYLFFEIVNGDLLLERTSTTAVDFTLKEGDLILNG